MAQKGVKCSVCGMTLSADNEEQLVKDLIAHAKQRHNMDMSEATAKEAVKVGHT
jgi:predicted small metal-binding protein